MTSEASYIRSLTIAVDHFMMSSELNECLGAQEKQWLFSKLPDVKDVSEKYVDKFNDVNIVVIVPCLLQVFSYICQFLLIFFFSFFAFVTVFKH